MHVKFEIFLAQEPPIIGVQGKLLFSPCMHASRSNSPENMELIKRERLKIY